MKAESERVNGNGTGCGWVSGISTGWRDLDGWVVREQIRQVWHGLLGRE